VKGWGVPTFFIVSKLSQLVSYHEIRKNRLIYKLKVE